MPHSLQFFTSTNTPGTTITPNTSTTNNTSNSTLTFTTTTLTYTTSAVKVSHLATNASNETSELDKLYLACQVSQDVQQMGFIFVCCGLSLLIALPLTCLAGNFVNLLIHGLALFRLAAIVAASIILLQVRQPRLTLCPLRNLLAELDCGSAAGDK